ncbi:MAG: alpha/beta hydrolase [Polyangiaceae bacterium]
MQSSPARARLESLFQGAARGVVRTLFSAPPPIVARLAGPLEKNDRGDELDPATQVLLRAIYRRLPPPSSVGLERLRSQYESQSPSLDFGPLPIHSVFDRTVEGADGPIGARVFEPRAGRDRAALVYFHGGGWVIGSPASHDGICRYLARETGAVVVSIDYRLAPEHPFPAAPRDAITAFRWVAANAHKLGLDPARLAVGGDSAGGNLAAVVAQATRADEHPPAFQLLVYPATDFAELAPSHQTLGRGYLLDRALMDLFTDHYIQRRSDKETALASPLRAADLGGLAPTYLVTAGFDPLRDEGEAYANLLERAGNRVTLRTERSMIHGFFTTGGALSSARQAIDRAANALSSGLGL